MTIPVNAWRRGAINFCTAVATALVLALLVAPAQAEIDGHGPDAWRVTGVAAGDVLNARMGPGTNYPAIDSFAHNARQLQLITCVPFHTAAHYMAMTEAQLAALSPRWCLIRDAALTKAGWVAQRFITPDEAAATEESNAAAPETDMVAEARSIVSELYDAYAKAEQGRGADPLGGDSARRFFTDDIVASLTSGQLGAHPLYGAQDFDGRITAIAADPDEPMLRGMITINVDFTNFGQAQRAIFRLRADTSKPDAPLRIFMVEHDGWSYPS